MAETLTAPEKESYPPVKRWTVEECEELEREGKLTERYELIYRVIYLKIPVNPPHRIALRLLFEWLAAIFGQQFVLKEDPIVLPGEEGKTTQPQPGAAVTREPTTTYTASNPGPSDLRLVGEVADTTLDYDLHTKALIYARVGIPEYLLLDITGRRLYRHRVPTDNGYSEIVLLSENDTLSVLNRPDTIRIGELLPPVPET